jgi:hypothetical protein
MKSKLAAPDMYPGPFSFFRTASWCKIDRNQSGMTKGMFVVRLQAGEDRLFALTQVALRETMKMGFPSVMPAEFTV